MMNVFLDANVIIDYMARREDYYHDAAVIITLGFHRKIKLYVASMSFATASYILERHYHNDSNIVKSVIRSFCGLCNITTIDSKTIFDALDSSFDDFEDGMQNSAAERCRADVIITRNPKDFGASPIECLQPQEFLERIASNGV